MPISRRREIKSGLSQLFLLCLFLLFFNTSSHPCDDDRCKTGSCDDNGECICQLPDPSTILDGDRPFFGGRFCDEERIMCDGTNSFWCEHGATCQEIVQGENYTCKCRPGYTGIHCENSGAPCGRIFCFHEAECLVEGETCECPPDWTGSIDCSKPTRSPTDITNSTTNKLPHVEKHNNTKWLAVVLGMLCFVAAVTAVAIYIKRLFKQKEETTLKFQQLSQMQTHDFLDDDDDENESFVPEIRSDGSQI